MLACSWSKGNCLGRILWIVAKMEVRPPPVAVPPQPSYMHIARELGDAFEHIPASQALWNCSRSQPHALLQRWRCLRGGPATIAAYKLEGWDIKMDRFSFGDAFRRLVARCPAAAQPCVQQAAEDQV